MKNWIMSLRKAPNRTLIKCHGILPPAELPAFCQAAITQGCGVLSFETFLRLLGDRPYMDHLKSYFMAPPTPEDAESYLQIKRPYTSAYVIVSEEHESSFLALFEHLAEGDIYMVMSMSRAIGFNFILTMISMPDRMPPLLRNCFLPHNELWHIGGP